MQFMNVIKLQMLLEAAFKKEEKMRLVVDRLTKQYKNKIAVDRISAEFGSGVYGALRS